MEQHPALSASPAGPPAASPVPVHWTPARQRIFLIALSDTGNVTRAARAAGMSARSAYRLRRRLAGSAFDHAWDQALAHVARMRANPFDPAAMPAPHPAPQPALQPNGAR